MLLPTEVIQLIRNGIRYGAGDTGINNKCDVKDGYIKFILQCCNLNYNFKYIFLAHNSFLTSNNTYIDFMLSPSFFERYLEIQVQILDRKISALKEKLKTVSNGMVREYRLKSIQLERKKNRIIREYYTVKKTGNRNYEELTIKLNIELQDVCKLYNALFSQLASIH
jgi:hypothetical protein